MKGEYDDIINMPRHVSKTRQPMPIINRASQFSPFAALTGHEEAVKETARVTEERIELDDHMKRILDIKLRKLYDKLYKKPKAEITYFKEDEKKEGGSYVTVKGRIENINKYKRSINMTRNLTIPIEDIINIEHDYGDN